MTDEISTLKGVFVFAATIIGAGILALPVAAATTGLFPMLLILLVVGAVSVFSALYIAETVVNTPGDHHLPSLAKEHLGGFGFAATFLVVIPPLVIALFKPEAFVNALDIAGTYGGGLFVGILPVLMVLRSRKKINTIKQMTWGGKWMPYIVLIIYLIGMFYGTMKLIS